MEEGGGDICSRGGRAKSEVLSRYKPFDAPNPDNLC